MLIHLLCAVALIPLLWANSALATQIYKCISNGVTQIQQIPCETTTGQKRPTVDELNAARQKQPPQEKAQALGPAKALPSPAAPQSNSLPSSNFRCDGRKHCSQMSSCSEAKFFLAQCPGVKMDGDNDGIPCEEQWCQ
ncbi:MAG: excalibur calcium-binding domain-containing protein [Rhodoferax sp.]|uniref:excalibur calcium-binding domain-containing protein n=1 Tax=Rhodoferax sp. TaxID=50421 RepID=UPI002ACD786D|nr:excalibur calcium-binding domain-containing protein [Rhodoferax sp.]MDZ7891443.1 excalibur calcium-binding domain-containing protein [Rhodoferax sp.]